MSKKFITGSFAVAAFAFAFVASAAYDFGTTSLKLGSRGEAVKAVQTVVGATPADGVFGAMTKAKVIAWQKANGLVADGIFGAASKAKANGAVVVTPTTPTTPTTPSTDLKGGAGTLTPSSTTTGLEDTLKEGEEDVKVYAFKAEAEDSDIKLTNMKVFFKNTGYANSSEKFTNYIDEVKVMVGSKEVGSADASDFSRDAGTPDEFTKTIALKDAVVKEGDKAFVYVAVTASSSIDSDDMNNADWYVDVENVRYTDATGAIMTENLEGDYEQTFSFKDSSEDDSIKMKSSSTDPDALTIKVDEKNDSDETLIGVFKLDVDEDSSDITINEIPVVLTFAGDSTAADSAEDIVDEVVLKINGEEFEADLKNDDVENNDGTARYLVSFDDDEMVIDAGDVAEVKIYATFNEQENNYSNGTTVKAAVTRTDIDAEGEDDDVTVEGTSFSSDTHTLKTSTAAVEGMKWVVSSTGNMADFFFTVEAEDDDFDVLTSSIAYTVEKSAGATVSAPTLTRSTGDTVESISGGFRVAEGEKTTFRARFDVTGVNGEWAEVKITSVAGVEVPDNTEVSPTVTRNVNN